MRTVLFALAMTALAPPAVSAGEMLAPLQMVRSLQLVQDRVAAGDHAALPIQSKLLEMIDARLRSGSDAELSEPANFQAMLVYAMSGGNPATLEAIMGRLKLDEKQSRLAVGVASYLGGGAKAASVAFRSVDPMKYPPELGAYLALVKGSVVALEDPMAALTLLDQARLLSPGTLVEEAALRRSLPLVASDGDATRFLLAAEQYVRTFLRSPYASQFADSFVAGIVTLHATLDLPKVEQTISMMSPEQQQVIYLRIARRSAIDGLTALSRFASARTVIAAAEADPSSDPRALLYSSLAGVASEPLSDVRDNLARIDRAKLSAGDLDLLDAVEAVSSGITDAPVTDAAAPSLPAIPVPQAAESVSQPQAVPAAAVENRDDIVPETAPVAAAAAPAPVPQPTPSGPAIASDVPASDVAPDMAEIALSEGRKKLGEIDDLLAKAAK